MFNLFEVFSTRIQDQSREFEVALLRIGSRRLVTITDACPLALAATPQSAAMEPVAIELAPPAHGSKRQTRGVHCVRLSKLR